GRDLYWIQRFPRLRWPLAPGAVHAPPSPRGRFRAWPRPALPAFRFRTCDVCGSCLTLQLVPGGDETGFEFLISLIKGRPRPPPGSARHLTIIDLVDRGQETAGLLDRARQFDRMLCHMLAEHLLERAIHRLMQF